MIVIKAPQQKLLEALNSVAGIVERRHTLPILANVLLRKNGDDIEFTTSDLEIQVRTHASLGGDAGSFAVTVGARKLIDILRTLPGDQPVTLTAVQSKLTLTGGLIVRSQLEDSAFVVPIIGFDWRIDDKWSLTTNYRTSIFPQPGLAIKYQACESVSLALGARYESRSFRLSDRDTPVDGVGRERRLPVELCMQWQITRHATLSATAGLVAWQRFRMDDTGGTRIAQFEADPTPVFGLAFTLAY